MGIMRSSSLKEDSHSKFHAITGVRARQMHGVAKSVDGWRPMPLKTHRHGSLINILKPASPIPNERPAASTRSRILSITCA